MNTIKSSAQVFLGATGKNGFINRFSDIYSDADDWQVYIIKGGPGSGKSTFMKRIAEAFSSEQLVICRCSSDPESLDALIFIDRHVMIADGTAPHVLEPQFPGARERILNFFDIFDNKQLYSRRDAIIENFGENAAHHKTAAAYIKSAGELLDDRMRTGLKALCCERAESYADSLCRRIFKARELGSRNYSVYLDAVTPDGYISFSETPHAFCDTVAAFDDEYGAAADTILKRVAANAEKVGLSAVICMHPILPDRIRGVLLPTINYAIVVDDFLSAPHEPTRTLHAKRFYDSSILHKNRQLLAFEKKAAKLMIDNAVNALRNAKISHDRLERHYISACDFTKLEPLLKKTIAEIKKD